MKIVIIWPPYIKEGAGVMALTNSWVMKQDAGC